MQCRVHSNYFQRPFFKDHSNVWGKGSIYSFYFRCRRRKRLGFLYTEQHNDDLSDSPFLPMSNGCHKRHPAPFDIRPQYTGCGNVTRLGLFDNFEVRNPQPDSTPTRSARSSRRAALESAEPPVLDVRERFLRPREGSTLGDLYNRLSMPCALSQAHANLDRAADRCYRNKPFLSDRDRVEHLFALYERLTVPLLPATSRRRRQSRTS